MMPPENDRPVLTVTIPLTVTISIDGAQAVAAASPQGAHLAADALARELGGRGALAVRHSLLVENGAITQTPCIAVAVHPDRLESLRAVVPASFHGFPVQLRAASIEDQLGLAELRVEESPGLIAYDDGNRIGPAFSFDWIKEPMKLRLHVGPERSFQELFGFLQGTGRELVSSMYQFYADHVRGAVEQALHGGATEFTLVLDPQTRDHGQTPEGQFPRAATFDRWEHAGQFERIYVPEGRGGFVDNAYHIKVTVRDGTGVWLSSGNWTSTSQPFIAEEDKNNPRKVIAAGNREWHVAAMNAPGLARVCQAHILQDFAACKALGGTEAPAFPEIMVDVPVEEVEAVEIEAPPTRLFEPLEVTRTVRLKPLLTPDRAGAVYCDAVLELIRSATRQLLMQNQYIKVSAGSSGRFGELVDALADAAKRLQDCRIVLRAGDGALADNAAELARRGVDIGRQLRKLTNTHTKGIIVDGQRVLVGSHNWSMSGVTANRDASLIFDDPEIAAYYAAVFEVDWARARPLVAPAPERPAARLAAGPAPPRGFRRIPLADYLEA